LCFNTSLTKGIKSTLSYYLIYTYILTAIFV